MPLLPAVGFVCEEAIVLGFRIFWSTALEFGYSIRPEEHAASHSDLANPSHGLRLVERPSPTRSGLSRINHDRLKIGLR